MKKVPFLLVLLMLGAIQIGFSQQTQVADLAGEYACLTQGVPASLGIVVNDENVEVTFCPDAQPDQCVTYIEIYPTLVEGKIMSKGPEPGDPPTDWPDAQFVVEESQGDVRITVFFANGIDYSFERE